MKTRTVTIQGWIVELIYSVGESAFISDPNNCRLFASREQARAAGQSFKANQGCRFVPHRLTAKGVINA